MSSAFYKVAEHVVDGQHIRGYPNGTKKRQEDRFKIAIKQYTPLDNPNLKEGAITIIAAHAIGVPKVKYLPPPYFSARVYSFVDIQAHSLTFYWGNRNAMNLSGMSS